MNDPRDAGFTPASFFSLPRFWHAKSIISVDSLRPALSSLCIGRADFALILVKRPSLKRANLSASQAVCKGGNSPENCWDFNLTDWGGNPVPAETATRLEHFRAINWYPVAVPWGAALFVGTHWRKLF
jgi:hypothetical protein